MPGKSDIKAGRAFVELFVKADKFTKGLRSASQSLDKFGSSVQSIGTKIAAMGTVAVGGLAAVTKAFISTGDAAVKASQRTGLSIKAFQQLAYAADVIAGATAQDFEAAMRTMQKEVGKLSEGNKATTETFNKLGISTAAFLNASPEDRFLMLVDALGKVEDSGERAALTMEVFGKSGAKMLPLIEAGTAGVAEARKEFERLGLQLTDEQAKQAEALGDAFGRIKTAAMGAAVSVGAALAPSLQKMADSITTAIPQITKWIKENQEVIVTVAQITAGVTAAGFAMTAFGTALKALSVSLLAVKAGVAALSLIATLANPLGLVVVAVTALGAALVHVSGILPEITSKLGPVGSAIQDAFEALTSGDISEAGETLAKSFEFMASVAKDAFMQIPKFATFASESALHAIQENTPLGKVRKSLGIPTRAAPTAPTIVESEETKKLGKDLADLRARRQGKRDAGTFRAALGGMGLDPTQPIDDPFATSASSGGGDVVITPAWNDPDRPFQDLEGPSGGLADLAKSLIPPGVLDMIDKAKGPIGEAWEAAGKAAEASPEEAMARRGGDVSVGFSAAGLIAQGMGGRGKDVKGTLDDSLNQHKETNKHLKDVVDKLGAGIVLAFR